MQYIQRYSLKQNQAAPYRQWLLQDAGEATKGAPAGWVYLGTWFTVRGFGHYDCETRWELADYSALGAGAGSEAFEKALQQAAEFIDFSRGGETCLMKSAEDLVTW